MASFACGTRDEPYMPPRGQTPGWWSAACHGGHPLNIYKLKATLCGLLCLRKLRPGIHVWNGMQFPLESQLGNCDPFWAWILGCAFRLGAHPESASHSECQFWDTVSACGVFDQENPGSRSVGYPGFWFVDMFDWLLVSLATLDQHDEGYHYERCSRCCCGGDHGERLVTGACEVFG